MGDILHLYVLLILIMCVLTSLAIRRIHQESSPLIEKEDVITRLMCRLDRRLKKEGSYFNARSYLIFIACLYAVIGVLSYLLIGNGILSILLGFVGAIVPKVYQNLMDTKKRETFEKEYVQALTQLSASIRAGLTIEQAIDALCTNYFLPEDIRERFSQISADMKIGIPIYQAFLTFAENADNEDAFDVASAISMQMQVGGQESLLLDSIIKNIRTRISVRKEIHTELTETDMMVNFFEVIPILLLVGMFVMMPDFMLLFFSSVTMTMIFFLLVSFIGIGTLINKKMVRNVKRF